MNLSKTRAVAAVAAVVGLTSSAPAAQAATIDLSGDFTIPLADPNPVPIDDSWSSDIELADGESSLKFTVTSRNFGGCRGELILSDLMYRSSTPGELTQTIKITESFTLAKNLNSGHANHYFSGEGMFAGVSQYAAIMKDPTSHETATLGHLSKSAESDDDLGFLHRQPIVDGPSDATVGTLTYPTWDVETKYTLTLRGGDTGGKWVQVSLPGGGRDQWRAVPEPSTLALLVLGGLILARQRRKPAR